MLGELRSLSSIIKGHLSVDNINALKPSYFNKSIC